jgi:hypothetical protein
MKSWRLAAAVTAGGAAAALTLVLLRRRPGRLRYDRGLAALRLFVRGGILCVPKTCATWVDASTGSRRRSAVSGTLLAMLA